MSYNLKSVVLILLTNGSLIVAGVNKAPIMISTLINRELFEVRKWVMSRYWIVIRNKTSVRIESYPKIVGEIGVKTIIGTGGMGGKF